MRAKLGALLVGLFAVGALVAPANTKRAEARSSAAPALASVAEQSPPVVSSLGASADDEVSTLPTPVAAPLEVVTPPPADLRLENPKLRRLHKQEITPAMLGLAASTVRKHYAAPIGTQIETDVEGKRVIARIERHFHPEGGPVKPWGFHPGVSLFVAR